MAARTPFTHLVLLLGMCAWLGGLMSASMHEALVQHTVCAEHGEVVELDGEVVSVAGQDGPQLRALDGAETHEHGCSFDLLLVDDVVISPSVEATPPEAPPQKINGSSPITQGEPRTSLADSSTTCPQCSRYRSGLHTV